MNEKNISLLFKNATSIQNIEAYEANKIGYTSRILIQATLPHSDLKTSSFQIKNGDLNVCILSNPKIGIPYGIYPRLLLYWVVTEAVKTKNPVLTLGSSLSQFMEKLGIIPTGGRCGTIAMLKKQVHRLFSSSISCDYSKNNEISTGIVFSIAKSYTIFWDSKNYDKYNLFDSTVTLNTDFFKEITDRPVPVDIRALSALKSSCVALDLYCWLTYRMCYLKKPTLISWEILQDQFGSNYQNTSKGKYQFKRKLVPQLLKVMVIYEKVKVEILEKGLVIKPSNTHIPQKIA